MGSPSSSGCCHSYPSFSFSMSLNDLLHSAVCTGAILDTLPQIAAMAASSSAFRARRPAEVKIWPAGTTVDAGTTAPGPTAAPSSTTTESSSTALAPTMQPLPILAARMTAPAPTVTLSPMAISPEVGFKTARSITLQLLPIEMFDRSPLTTALYHTLLFVPRVTLPMTLAVGATKQPSLIFGASLKIRMTLRWQDNGSL
mmetsp:Transcript_33129/g.104775  ORF Transcript_33129/g.104775 Transcript_33129/m.104775 type:complete len:200 (+) Transcript_33129:112-711(+)